MVQSDSRNGISIPFDVKMVVLQIRHNVVLVYKDKIFVRTFIDVQITFLIVPLNMAIPLDELLLNNERKTKDYNYRFIGTQMCSLLFCNTHYSYHHCLRVQ